MLVQIGTYKLNDGTRAGGHRLSWDSLRVARGVEVITPIRALAISTADRFNDVTEIGCSITRIFATLDAATVFVLEHPADVPREGLVQFISVADDRRQTVRYLQQGRVRDIALVEQKGVHVVFSYSFVGGLFTKTKPTS